MDKEQLKALGLDDGKADEVLKLFGADEAKRQEVDKAAALEREQLKESVKNYEAQLATLKTNSGDAEALRAQIAQLEAGLKAAGYDETLVGEAQAMVGVKGEYLEAAFDAVKREYGSVEEYLRNQLGVSDEKLYRLREKYLESK